MNTRLDPVDHQRMIQPLRLRQIANDQPLGRNRRAMAHRKVVIHTDIMPALEKKADGMAAYVAGAAGDEDAHFVNFRPRLCRTTELRTRISRAKGCRANRSRAASLPD